MFSDEAIDKIRQVKIALETKLTQSGFYELLTGAVISADYFFVSGGCFASYLSGEEPKDIDLYCTTTSVGERFKEYIIRDGMSFVQDNNPFYGSTIIEGKLVTNNAITFKNDVQFITRQHAANRSARDEFDFEHCMPYYAIGFGKLYISELQYHLCKNKLLKKRNVISVVDRTQKFLGRGFHIYGG
jgi:hypothetical protein